MAWVRFHARYYVVALFFVLFDIEAALLLPWSHRPGGGDDWAGRGGHVRRGPDARLAWAIRKGALQWV